ncbi:hypothetical protein [Alteromonas ponticola]|uniref:DUF4402 domain-containing protein n=1 Tax=Alteromonas ponticola TaxID=2720613 RepID=A0ABX1R2X9_9ALTE|nr:hypothetical protein [Alteromonas ponticola]NMH60814.1 hypothetical protein [Alteromonas ponticola]
MIKRVLFLAAISSLSGSVYAASQVFQASVDAMQDATITETTPLHFGSINPTATSVCTMTNTGTVSGDCDASAGSIAAGLITITGISENVPLNVSVSGGTSTELSFVSTYDINNASASHESIADSTVTAVTTTAIDLTIDVYGAVTVGSTLTAGTSYTVPYTVDVTFQ